MLLVARSGTHGSQYRLSPRGRLFLAPFAFFPGQGFKGILNLFTYPKLGEADAPASDFKGAPTGHLELTGYFADFYPEDHLPEVAALRWPSGGVSWNSASLIVLIGFTARRSDRWKVFHIHDWTYEQVIQRVLARSGRLLPGTWPSSLNYAAVTRRFPDIGGGRRFAGRRRSAVAAARSLQHGDRQADLGD